MRLFVIAWRNFSKNLSRYKFLLGTLSFAVIIMVVALGIFSGIIRSIEDKASRYFAGDISIQEYTRVVASIIQNEDIIIEAVKKLAVPIKGYSLRSVYYRNNSKLFFNGYYASQRRLVGVEWELEQNILSELSFIEGSLPDLDIAESSILISSATAKQLNVRAGDEVLLSLQTQDGPVNTGMFIVSGIFNESSFFGYTSYLSRRSLNNLVQVSESRINEIGIFLENRNQSKKALNELMDSLSDKNLNLEVFKTREERDSRLSNPDFGYLLAALPLDSQLAQIKDLIDALSIITILVLAVFLVIIIIGVSNTFNLIIYERTKEIGTMRALGLRKSRTRLLFLHEAGIIGAIALIIGTAIGIILLKCVCSIISLPMSGFFTLFLENGEIIWYLPPMWVVAIFLTVLFSCLIGAFKPAAYASEIVPVEALRTE